MPCSIRFQIRVGAILSLTLMAAACDDPVTPVSTPEGTAPQPNVIACRADVKAGAMTCREDGGAPAAGVSLSVILGGQGTFVRLTADSVRYVSGTQIFEARVAVQNLIGQRLGTADGTTLHADGIRVFFHSAPTVTVGSGVVSVANPSGQAAFTGSSQPYFQYDQILASGETSSGLLWQWNVPATVGVFVFEVYVAAPVPFPDGWVEIAPQIAWIAPGGSLQLQAVAKDAIGRNVQRGFTWNSLNQQVLAVGPTGLVAAVDYGVAYISAASDGPEATGFAGMIVDGFAGGWSAVSAGAHHTCGLDTFGKAYCWGSGVFGQLGKYGARRDYAEPVPVWPGLTIRRYASISASARHSCATAQSLWDWDAYCWGGNLHGELGTSDTRSDSVPVPVYGSLPFATVSAGDEHTCALALNGTALCWGNNDNGQLGRGWSGGLDSVAYPVTGNLSFADIDAGWRHTCAVTASGDVYCWGNNEETQLGIGSHSLWVNTPGRVVTPVAFRSVSASSGYTCGVSTSNEAYCWGLNGPWIGAVDPVIVPTHYQYPVVVQGGLAFASISVSPGADGFSHTCGVATGGDAYCWGYNHNGQLGDGTTVDRDAPTLVSGGLTFQSLSAGEEHTCGVTSSGDLYCWGLALYGRLGNGETLPVSHSIPQPVAAPALLFAPPATATVPVIRQLSVLRRTR